MEASKEVLAVPRALLGDAAISLTQYAGNRSPIRYIPRLNTVFGVGGDLLGSGAPEVGGRLEKGRDFLRTG